MARRHKRTKAQRAAIASRMRAYHAKRRAAKAQGDATVHTPTIETVQLSQHRLEVDHLVTTIDDLRTQVRDLIRVSLLLTLKLGGTH